MTTSIDLPRGVGCYLSRAMREWDARKEIQQARKAESAGISHVVLCAEAKDGWVAPHHVLLDVAKCYQEQAGCQVSVYSLPGAKSVRTPEATASRLIAAGEVVDAFADILDSEEEYAGLPRMLERAANALINGVTERRSVAFTNYGVPTKNARFPWSAILGKGWFGWQCYETAADVRLVRARLEILRGFWGHHGVVPHLATYKRRADPHHEGVDGARRLDADLKRTLLNGQGICDVRSFFLWQDSTLDANEAAVVRRWSERLKEAA